MTVTSNILQVTGVNEFPPVFGSFSPIYVDSTTPYPINEDFAIGTSIVTIYASDNDTGINGAVLYSIDSVSVPGLYKNPITFCLLVCSYGGLPSS